jgi:putative membrane protein
MLRFLARFAIGVGGFWLAQRFVDGIDTNGWTSLVIAALLLGLANAIIRPVVVFITFPLTLLTLGLFLLVVNAAMLGLVAWVMPGLTVAGFVPALLGAIVIGVCSWIGDQLLREANTKI